MKRILLILALLFTQIVYAQSIEFVVKSAAGGPDDTVTRKIAEHLERTTGMNFVVVNKPGASHTIGYSHFESSTHPSLILADPNIQTHSVYNSSEKIFTVGEFSNILFVKNGSGIENVNDLFKLSKTREIRFGHGGEGTFGHIAAVKLCQQGLNCLYVPYKSGAPGMLDLMSGQIDAFSIISYGTSQYLSNDKLNAIMLYSNTKHPKMNVTPLPNNFRQLEIKNWVAIFARNLTEKQTKDIVKALSSIDKTFFIDSGLWIK